jgi:hypothetical protein
MEPSLNLNKISNSDINPFLVSINITKSIKQKKIMFPIMLEIPSIPHPSGILLNEFCKVNYYPKQR